MQSRFWIIDHLKRLREDDAVEKIRLNVVGVGQVRDDGGFVIPGDHVKNIDLCHGGPAEFLDIRCIHEFQHAAPDYSRVCLQELLNVVAVDRQPTIEAEDRADRAETP